MSIRALRGLKERTVAGLVAAKFGVALIPMIPGIDKSKISLMGKRKPNCIRVIQMVWRTNGFLSPAVAHFKTFVEKNAVAEINIV